MCGPDSFSLPKSRARDLARPSTHPSRACTHPVRATNTLAPEGRYPVA